MRQDDLDRFYGLLAILEQQCGGKRQLADCNGQSNWPKRGIYFFFENGETRADGAGARVTRVGTHALRPSKSTLWGRLSQHRGTTGGTMPGGGNQRGSIFRHHVGTALLASGEWPEGMDETWAIANNASTVIRQSEYQLEKAVTQYIGLMPFLWLEIDDPPSAQSDRGVIETGAISLLSNYERTAIDAPSTTWLGKQARSELVKKSGLWNVNHVKDSSSDRFIDTLEKYIHLSATG